MKHYFCCHFLLLFDERLVFVWYGVTFVWTSLLLWIRFTGRTCNFIIDVTHDGVRFRWCCTWHWFRSWRLMPIPIGNELFLWWLHCTLLFIQFMGYFGTVLNSCLASILPNFIHAIYTHTHTHTSKHSNMLQIVQKLEHVKTNIFYWNLTFWRDENWRPIYRIEMLNWFKIPMPLKWLWKNWTHEHTTNRWIFFKVSFTVQTLWTFNLNLLKQYLLSFWDFFMLFGTKVVHTITFIFHSYSHSRTRTNIKKNVGTTRQYRESKTQYFVLATRCRLTAV